MSGGPSIEIKRDGDKLMAQPDGSSPAQLFPEAETKFLLKVIDAQITFVKDASGVVTGLIFRGPGGQNMPGAKVK